MCPKGTIGQTRSNFAGMLSHILGHGAMIVPGSRIIMKIAVGTRNDVSVATACTNGLNAFERL